MYKPMKKILLTFVLIFVYSMHGYSQSELDAYEYIIVPKNYKVLKDENKYKLNTLTAFLFKKKGFSTYIDGEEFPEDLQQNPCKALTVQMVDNSNLFTSKVYLELENCQKKVVYTSKIGTSKEKDFQKSYQAALRDAFTSIENMNYSYNPALNPLGSGKPAVAAAVQTNAPVKVTVPESTVVQTVVPAVTTVPVAITAAEESKQPLAVQTDAPVKVTVPEPTAVQVVVPVAQTVPVKSDDRAHAYKNSDLTFLLIPSGDGFQAYISESKLPEFKKGEILGNLRKTSLPNVFRVSWKNREGKPEETTGYFDEKGSLVIDVQDKNGEIKTLVFAKEN